MSPETPRIPGLDTEWADQLLDFLESEQQELGGQLPSVGGEPDQIRHSLFAAYSLDLAALHYALGHPLDQVIAYLDDATLGHWYLFAQRGSTKAFPWELVTIRNRMSAGEETVDYVEKRGGDDRDYSMTNSRKGLLAVYVTLMTKGRQVAQELASLVSDPPNATYIGPRSEICTPNDHHLAYAFKGLLANSGTLHDELERLQDPSPSIAFQSQLFLALESRNGRAFLNHLAEFSDWQLAELKSAENHRNTELFLNLSALGLCELALDRSLLELNRMLQVAPELPYELLRSGKGREISR